MGINKNTVCSWAREYRRKNQMPSYTEEKRIRNSTRQEDAELKRKKGKGSGNTKIEEGERESEGGARHPKKCMHIFMQQAE